MGRIGVLLIVLLTTAGQVSAAAPSVGGQGWKRQLPALQQKQPAAQALANGRVAARDFPGSPYTIEDLLARRALNPQRFDRYHPSIGRLLERDLRERAACANGQSTMNGILVLTPFHRYLKYLRSLNPRRFDTLHPLVGPILAEDDRLRAMICPMPQILLPPPTSIGSGGGGGGGPTPPGVVMGNGGDGPGPGPGPTQLVPEPSALVLMMIGSVGLAGSAIRRRRARPAGRGSSTR